MCYIQGIGNIQVSKYANYWKFAFDSLICMTILMNDMNMTCNYFVVEFVKQKGGCIRS